MKKMFIISILFALGLAAIFFVKQRNKQAVHKADITLGILQTISIQALDRVHEGFVSKMKSVLGDRVQFIVQNAQGSVGTAQMIASSFHRNPEIKGMLTIGTLATQVMSNNEKQKPIFMSAVSDTKALGVVYPGTNVCGTSDLVDVEKNLNDTLMLLPAAKLVVLLHNPSEVNSSAVASIMEKILAARGIQTQRVGVNSDADIPSAVSHACRVADVIIVPTDTTIASAIRTVGSIALKAKKPVIVCDNELVCPGILMAAGSVDYFNNGEETAEIALKVLLQNQKPDTLPVVNPTSGDPIIHRSTAEALGIEIPQNFKHKAM